MKTYHDLPIGETIQVAGKDIIMVHKLPTEVVEELENAIQLDFEELRKLGFDPTLKVIGWGSCATVYDLGDYVLKVNYRRGLESVRDGQILHDLQGIPCIPKLYAYSPDNRYLIIQKIDGYTINEIEGYAEEYTQWNYEKQKQNLKLSNVLINERGWAMQDIHEENCMVDKEGNFWVIDVGYFSKDEGYFNSNYDEAMNLLNWADCDLKHLPVSMTPVAL